MLLEVAIEEASTKKDPLSAGAIAGISVGCVAAVGAIGAAVFVVLKKKKAYGATPDEDCVA